MYVEHKNRVNLSLQVETTRVCQEKRQNKYNHFAFKRLNFIFCQRLQLDFDLIIDKTQSQNCIYLCINITFDSIHGKELIFYK